MTTAFFLVDPKVVAAIRQVIAFYKCESVEAELHESLVEVRAITDKWKDQERHRQERVDEAIKVVENL